MKIKKLVGRIVIMASFFLSSAYGDTISKDILVSNAWVQAMPPSQRISAAYMVITNNAQKEAVLISISSDMVGVAEIHEMSEANGIMHMEKVVNLRIPAQGKVALHPGGYHIMLINLKKSVNKGDIVPLMLHFQDGGSIIVKANVRDDEIG